MKDHVERCLLRQTNKMEQVKHPGLMQPLSVPNKKWVSISMDFIVDHLGTQRALITFLWSLIDKLRWLDLYLQLQL